MSKSPESADPNGAQLAALHAALAAHMDKLKPLIKSLEKATAKGADNRIDLLAAARQCLNSTALGPFDFNPLAQPTLQDLDLRLRNLRLTLRAQLMSALHSQAQQEGTQIEVLSDTPLTLLLAPLVLEADLDNGSAALFYAREKLAEMPLEAKGILAQRKGLIETIRKNACDSASFWAALLKAYRMVLVHRDLPQGERVDLVDTLAPLAWLLDPSSGRKTTPYPRHMLAYQLYRLQREAHLQHEGLRLELGTATGGSTRHKAKVLFVPSSHTEGFYYLSLRFVSK